MVGRIKWNKKKHIEINWKSPRSRSFENKKTDIEKSKNFRKDSTSQIFAIKSERRVAN